YRISTKGQKQSKNGQNRARDWKEHEKPKPKAYLVLMGQPGGDPKANDWLLGRVTHLRAQIDLREEVEEIRGPRFKMRASPLSPHRTSTNSTP
ncbi:hypothetical protein Tco_1047056, partial [Tanacetum coccineum]